MEKKTYRIDDVLAKAREEGIDVSPAQRLELAMLLGAGETGIKVVNLDEGTTKTVTVNQEALREFMEGTAE